MNSSRFRSITLSLAVILMMGLAATMAFAQSSAITITSILPGTINPAQGQVATITYVAPVLASYRMSVLNSTGTRVTNYVTYNNQAAGTYKTTWNGKDSTGRNAANGTYTVLIEGRTSTGSMLTSARGTVIVGTTSSTPQTFAITGIVPASIDPSKAQTATINYTVPTTATYSVIMYTSKDVAFRVLSRYYAAAAGAKTITWDGKNSSGAIVANGTYTVKISGASSTGATITTAQGTITVSTATVMPQAFAITGIVPATIDPSKTQTATISYTVPTTANYSVVVRNSASTVVRTLGTYTAAVSGAKTATFDGKNDAGAVVADGSYTVYISGTSSTGAAITAAQGTITVSTTVTPPPPTTGSELGQTIEGAGSANFNWLAYAGRKFGIAFKSPKTGSITQITLQWKKSGGYGAGNYGTYTFELQTNGTGNFPSGTVIASTKGVNPTTAMDGYSDGAFHFNIAANLTAGTVYHLVITNTDANVTTNWSSPNTLMTRVKAVWDGSGNMAEAYQSGAWTPWGSTHNPFNTGGGNNNAGSHCPTMLTWSDGSITGDPYYSAALSAGAKIYGTQKYGEYIAWKQASTTISKVGISVGKVGTPGALIYHLEKIGSGDVATGTIATAAQVGSPQTWVYATLPSPVTLTQGQNYRLWFESPSSSSSSYYSQNIPYGESRPAIWLEGSWGGTASYYTYNTSGSWTVKTNYDLSFSLQ